jgi:hypothetical protein
MKSCLLAITLGWGCIGCASTPPSATNPAPEMVGVQPSASSSSRPKARPKERKTGTVLVVFHAEDGLWVHNSAQPGLKKIVADKPDSGAGTVLLGENSPLVSPNRQWIAYVHDQDLWIVKTNGEQKQRITKVSTSKIKPWPKAIEVYISGWSEDSNLLAYYLGEPSYEEESPLPAPPGTKKGFHLLNLKTHTNQHLPEVKSFVGITSDGKAIVGMEDQGPKVHQFLSYPIPTGKATNLFKEEGYTVFSQIAIHKNKMAFVASNAVFSQQLSVPTRVQWTPRGAYAEYQYPRWNPNADKLAAQRILPGTKKHFVSLVINQDTEPRTIHECTTFCNYSWLDNDRLLVPTSEGAVVVSITTNKSVPIPGKGTVVAVGNH